MILSTILYVNFFYLIIVVLFHSKHSLLLFLETPKIPIIIKYPKTINSTESEILKIEAQYVAYPEAIVKWYKDGHVLHPCPQLDFVMGPNGNIALVIEKATLEDAGDYEIAVSNELGEATGQIEVQVKPALTAPAFITPLKDSKVVEGFPAKLQFKLSGFPLPNISWYLKKFILFYIWDKYLRTYILIFKDT